MSLQCRLSTGFDVFLIEELIQECFGDRDQFGVLENIEKRYWLIFDGDKLVGMTGLLNDSPEYNGAEIDWTCLLPKYRGRGIMTNAIKEVIKNCDKDIYCSCWKNKGKDKINLHNSMDELGFVLVSEGHKKYNSKSTKACAVCVNRVTDCYCQEDLYVKYHKKGNNPCANN